MEWVGTAFVAGSTPTTQYVLTTIAVFGLQFVWSIEQTFVSIYLLDLGMSKSLLSLIWIAGPLCGLIVQPIVGVYSDFCTSQYGRRRPFMIWGAFATTFGLLAFGWSRDIAEKLQIKHVEPLVVAVIAILTVDIAVNVCQACCRSLIVDIYSAKRQKKANGWASRMASVGHLVSYFMSSFDLTKLGFGTQLKAACCIYSTILLLTVAISATAVKERVLISPIPFVPPDSSSFTSDLATNDSMFARLKQHVSRFWSTTVNLDTQLQAIFKVQLLAWYSWFTFMFYGATYAAEVWQRAQTGRGTQDPSAPSADDMARAGSLALTVFSLSSTLFTFILPRLNVRITKIWVVSFVVYAIAMLTTRLAQNLREVLVIFAVVGFAWAATLWIPYALTAERIHQLPLDALPEFQNEPREEVLHVDTDSIDDGASLGGHDEKSGIILGIHNSALTLPQFISAFCSFVIFKLVEKNSSQPADGGYAISITLQVGALPALLAAIYAAKVKRPQYDSGTGGSVI